MKFLRNRLVNRTISIFFLLVFIQSLVLPNYSYALTSGPHQPEYTSYDEPGASDMVNLLTGDFSFSLPIIDVPGPEGNFSLPLTYNAGIGTEQQASWVGLGWNINAGAILRHINSFPDDAVGQEQNVTVQDLTGFSGWDTKIWGIGQFGYNNSMGHFGNLSLLSIVNAEWTEHYTSVGVAGVNVTSNGVKFDGMQAASAAMTVASFGAAGIEGGFAAAAKEAAINLAVSAAIDGAMTLARGGNDLAPKTVPGYWEYSKHKKTTFIGIGRVKEYRVWLDKSRVERMYGALYLGNAPVEPYVDSGGNTSLGLQLNGTTTTLYKFPMSSATANFGAASDINYEPDPNVTYYAVKSPTFLAYDNFNVQAAGISGGITPYRLDVGSVSVPREMTANHERLAPVQYLKNDGTPGSYKVPFIYKGQPANSYFHQMGALTSLTSPAFYMGISSSLTDIPGQNKRLNYLIDDFTLGNQRISANIPSTNQIPQGNHVEWLSNNEVASSKQYSSRYMDFLSPGTESTISATSDRYIFRTTPSVGSTITYSSTPSFNYLTIPVAAENLSKILVNDYIDLNVTYYASSADYDNGNSGGGGYQEFTNIQVTGKTSNSIAVANDSRFAAIAGKNAVIEVRIKKSIQSTSTIGAFCITAIDGMTYHFGFPIYDYENYSEIHKISDPVNNRSVIKRNHPFATSWLLTAITGPDFIDRDANGMIDETDWGKWIKFNYGLQMSDYNWRLPYSGNKPVTLSEEAFTSGKKQLVFLNSIETRSHVALFMKSGRSDGKSANSYVSQFPLKLDEIQLLTREHYKTLTKLVAQGGFGMPELSNQFTTLYTNSTLSAGALDYVKRNCERRVVFTYDYSLCPGTSNSIAGGKLTLTRLSIVGRNDLKAVPDYKFEYGFNPAYGATKWDNYGMYLPTGGTLSNTHDPSSSSADAAAWSLTKVTTPLGMDLAVNYERDVYTSVSGTPNIEQTGSSIYIAQPQPAYSVPTTGVYVPNASIYVPGEKVYVDGSVTFKCMGDTYYTTRQFIDYFTITLVNTASNYIEFGTDFMGLGNCAAFEVNSRLGAVYKTNISRNGGNLRVGSIVTSDEFGNQTKMRYLYNNDPVPAQPNGYSSGVVSKDQQLILHPRARALNTMTEYPSTPVMYSKVTVLSGKLANDNDYHTKLVYEFETPHYDQFKYTAIWSQNSNLINTYNGKNDYFSLAEHRIEDRTSQIGRLKSIKTYAFNNPAPVTTQTLTYTSDILNNGVNNYHGIYASGVLMFDRVTGATSNDKVHKLGRTTLLNYPWVLSKTVSSKDGFTSEVETKSWNFLTGLPNERWTTSSLGVKLKTLTIPAYSKAGYSEMGSKAQNVANKNMLIQEAESYTYRIDAAGQTLGLVDATAQTWKKDWNNYRFYNSTTGVYSDGDDEPVGVGIWRKGPAYVWKGNYGRLNPDGTSSFSPTDEFNFSGSNALWQYTGEFTKFDHYGMPLESKDLNNIYSSIIMGYKDGATLARCANARYNEITFSSAEDLYADKPYFGGEVTLGGGTVKYLSKGQTITTHTGDAVVALSSGYAFTFKTSGLEAGKRYRTAVWTNNTNGRIYYKINGGSEVLSSAPTSSKLVNGWYLIDLELPVQASAFSLEVGVKSTSGEVYFDDFRFQPSDAAMTCYVYPPSDFEFTATSSTYSNFNYVLDNDNFFTKFEHNERGLLTKTYRESFKYGVKLISESKDNYRRFNVNQ
jgi:hypothetical protein